MPKPTEIVVISGKGGTGKTVLTSSLAFLAENKITADCDVVGRYLVFGQKCE